MNKIHHGDTENTEKSRRFSRRSLRLCVFCVKYSLPVLVAGLLAHTVATTHAQTHQPIPPEKRLRYQIKLALDFDNRAYTGTERVRFVNRGDHPRSEEHTSELQSLAYLVCRL